MKVKEILKKIEQRILKVPRRIRRNTSLTVFWIFVSIGIISSLNFIRVHQQKRLVYEVNNKIKFEEIIVRSGDTASELQNQLTPKEDYRKMLFYAKQKKENENIEFNNLKVGEIIYLPIINK